MLTRLLVSPVLLATMLYLAAASQLLAQGETDRRRSSPAEASAEATAEKPFTLTAEQIAQPPERELEFEEVSTPLEQRLPRPDPKLLEKKFAATFAVELLPNSAFDNSLTELNQLQELGQGYLLFPHSEFARRNPPSQIAETLRRLLEAAPDEQRPPADATEFLKADPVDIQTVLGNNPNGSGLTRQFTLYAESPEEARSAAAAILKILDNGLTRGYQLALFERQAKVIAEAEKEQQAFDAATAEYAKLQKEAAEVADFPADLLPNLRVQQLQLEVDLAGTKSRIEASQKLLDGDSLNAPQRDKVRDLKMAAEIDLASFEARQTTISGFIENVKRSAELNRQLAVAAGRRDAHRRSLSRQQVTQANLQRQIVNYQPLPLVGKIRVQPLTWTQ